MTDLLAVILEGIGEHKQSIDDINEILDLLKDETRTNTNEIEKTKEVLNKRIEDILIQTSKMIEKVSLSIKAEEVDYSKIEAMIKDKEVDIKKIEDYFLSVIPKDGEDGKDGIDGKDGLNGKDGNDGLNADNDLIISELKAFLNTNKEDFRGLRGIKGDKGDSIKGDDGIGIDDIYEKNNYLFIVLTNGDIRKFKLPQSKTVYGGGGSTSTDNTLFNNRNEIEGAFKYASLSSFKEMIYSGTLLTGIDIYKDDTKTIKLFTKTFNYDLNNQVSSVVLKDEVSGYILTKTINYIDGNVSSIKNDIIQ